VVVGTQQQVHGLFQNQEACESAPADEGGPRKGGPAVEHLLRVWQLVKEAAAEEDPRGEHVAEAEEVLAHRKRVARRKCPGQPKDKQRAGHGEFQGRFRLRDS
jgi:hypothetical protein